MNDLMTKSFVSYVDLKKEAMKDLETGPDPEYLEMTTGNYMTCDLGLFLEEAEKVKTEMGLIRDILTRLQEANEETKQEHKPESLQSIRNRINTDIMSVLRKARAIKSQVEDMDLANKRLSGCKEGSPVYRTRMAVTNGLRKKLRDLMMEFQGLRQRVMAEYRETVGRRYFAVTGERAGEEAIERIIAEGGEKYMRRAIEEQGRGRVMEAVAEIQDRHEGAKEIERSLLELHQVFMDMAVMVEAQGEHMDDIHHHVVNAKHYVKGGTKELTAAKGYQMSSRKWMCLGLIVLLILILVVLLPIATTFSN